MNYTVFSRVELERMAKSRLGDSLILSNCDDLALMKEIAVYDLQNKNIGRKQKSKILAAIDNAENKKELAKILLALTV